MFTIESVLPAVHDLRKPAAPKVAAVAAAHTQP
jgi:hypothetical protein